MKYRIIKHGYKNPYYIAQYVDMDSQEWKTVTKRFSTPKAARKALREIARDQIGRSQVRVVEEDVV